MLVTEDKVNLIVKDSVDTERERSDNRYAVKLVERIVFTLLGLAFVGMFIYIVNLIFIALKYPHT